MQNGSSEANRPPFAALQISHFSSSVFSDVLILGSFVRFSFVAFFVLSSFAGLFLSEVSPTFGVLVFTSVWRFAFF